MVQLSHDRGPLSEIPSLHPEGVDMQIQDVDVARCRRSDIAGKAPGRRPELISAIVGEGEGIAAPTDAGEIG